LFYHLNYYAFLCYCPRYHNFEICFGQLENNRPSVDYLDGNKSVVNSGNSPLKTKVYLENNEVLSNNDIADEYLQHLI
jgi:hypothetical protein